MGRAANLALASLPGFTLPADLSASDRYFRRDVTTPFVLADGHLGVPVRARHRRDARPRRPARAWARRPRRLTAGS